MTSFYRSDEGGRSAAGREPRLLLAAMGARARTLAAFVLVFVVPLGISAPAALATPPTLTVDAVTTHSIVTVHLSGEVDVPADGLEPHWCLEPREDGTEVWSGFCPQGSLRPGEKAGVPGEAGGRRGGPSYEPRL